jgi:DNA-binding transcriptional ArsR family regulator
MVLNALPVADVMKALADPTRRGMFERLSRAQELSVSELTELSPVSQGAVSQHLAALKAAGLVSERAEGRRVYYRARPEGLAPLFDWMTHYDGFWRDRFTRLHQVLKEIDQ